MFQLSGVHYMGGCQNYGPFLGPYYNTAPIFRVPQKGTLIWTTTHMHYHYGIRYQKTIPIMVLGA